MTHIRMSGVLSSPLSHTGLCKGVKLDIFFPGFPTLKHIPYRARLAHWKVKVFQANSRGENMTFTLYKEQTDSDIVRGCTCVCMYFVCVFVGVCVCVCVCVDILKIQKASILCFVHTVSTYMHALTYILARGMPPPVAMVFLCPKSQGSMKFSTLYSQITCKYVRTFVRAGLPSIDIKASGNSHHLVCVLSVAASIAMSALIYAPCPHLK